MKTRTSVLLAEDHPLVLSALERLISSERSLELTQTCRDGLAAIAAVEAKRPDVAVVDVRMPGLSGLQFLQEVRSRKLPVRVALFTAEISDAELYDAILSGVDGIVFKSSLPETLIACIHTIAAGGKHLSDAGIIAAVEQQLELRERQKLVLGRLSYRERDIATMVASHLSNKEIADALNITEGTVKVHLHSIFSKLAIADRSSLRSLVSQTMSYERVVTSNTK